VTGGHLGRAKTEQQVQLRAYWPQWRTQVAMELKKCHQCVSYHRGSAPRQTPLHPFNAGEPFEVLALDITGPHPRSTRGHEYIVTIIDLFSKWAEAIPVRSHTAPIVARVLIDNVITRFGTPRRLLTDQGREFESELFQELCQRLDIDKIRTTAYEPRTNSCVERFHRTLNSMLGKVVHEHQRDWDDHLPLVMMAYRASKHTSTDQSPNMTVLGRENRAPIDVILGPIVDETEQYDSYNDYVQTLQQRLRTSHQLVREHLNVAAERRKVDYDIKVKAKTFTVGTWVYYFYPRRYKSRSPKWSKNYDGPYLITKVLPPCDYVLQKTKKSRPFVTHQDKLRTCYGPTPTSWLSTDGTQLAERPDNDCTE